MTTPNSRQGKRLLAPCGAPFPEDDWEQTGEQTFRLRLQEHFRWLNEHCPSCAQCQEILIQTNGVMETDLCPDSERRKEEE